MSIYRIYSASVGFARDERGSATIWNLFWLLLFVGIAGLAIDSTNAWRVKTMMASTADVAALAGAWELPESYLEEGYDSSAYDGVRDDAIAFAGVNMSNNLHGDYIEDEDIDVGYWDQDERRFVSGEDYSSADEYPVNAVAVRLGLNEAKDNRLQTTLLRVAGIYHWNINTQAVALYGVNRCLVNGLIAREGFYMAPGAKVLNNVCLHGQYRVDLQPGVEHKYPGNLTTGETPAPPVGVWDVREGQIDMNTGQQIDMSDPQRINLYPPMVDYIPTIARRMLRGELHYRHFAYPKITENLPIVTALPSGFRRILGTFEVTSTESDSGMIRFAGNEADGPRLASLGSVSSLVQAIGLGSTGTVTGGYTARYEEVQQTGDQKWAWPTDQPHLDASQDGFGTTTDGITTAKEQTLPEGGLYFAKECQANTLHLAGVIRNVTIVTNCSIDISSTAKIENSVLFTTNSGAQSVQISNGARLGAVNACESWGGVRVYSNGTIKAPSTGSSVDSQFWGVQLVAREDIHFSAQSDQSKGITMLAGGDIHITANASIGALDASELPPSPDEGCPPDGVHKVFDKWSYEPVLVH